MEKYFAPFRNGIIGLNTTITTPYGNDKKVLYADWTASGRNYRPIEERMCYEFMPYVANTHTETNDTGMAMTQAYSRAKRIIKQHVNAKDTDVLLSCGSGMTGVINKFQRILGFRIHEKYKDEIVQNLDERPMVFVTHMEHHSNQTSWLETIAEVVIVEPNELGLVCLESFQHTIDKYSDRTFKIAAITSCSNVTGIMTNYHEVAEIMHKANGYCFVDFACSAPYVNIDMHPLNEDQRLDAIYFSPHKFLGGPGTTGIIVFNKSLYHNQVPDHPGGGTVDFTNPWGGHKFVDDIESREDGGTPAFLQTIKVALCVKLKDEMGVENIMKRELELMDIVWEEIGNISNIHILAAEHKERVGVISFYIDNLHYNVGVKMLNDKFGIQTRGGCSCAGTYGHYLLNVDTEVSQSITSKISMGDCSSKPGWIRMSIHPTMTNDEIHLILDGIKSLALNFKEWQADYKIDHSKGEIINLSDMNSVSLKKKMDSLLDRVLT